MQVDPAACLELLLLLVVLAGLIAYCCRRHGRIQLDRKREQRRQYYSVEPSKRIYHKMKSSYRDL
jgi:hypothetical protein